MGKRVCVSLLLCASAILLVGCGSGVIPTEGAKKEIENNDSFSDAQSVADNSTDTFVIQGVISSSIDIDVYTIGSFPIGTTITIQVRGIERLTSDKLQVALFDKDQEIAWLEPSVSAPANFETLFTYSARKEGTYYLAVTSSNLYSSAELDYEVLVQHNAGSSVSPKEQTVYLNYHGASNLYIGGLYFDTLLPITNLDSRIGVNSTALAGNVTSIIRSQYSGFNIDLVSSFDASEPSASHSTVFITASTGSYFGLADSVDWYNADPLDRAVIFAKAIYETTMTDAEYAQAVANVVSHELGHLIGLAHTVDHTELMDEVTPTNLLEKPQTFHEAPLADFPIGTEDPLELFEFILGLSS